jgi:hypothetical protein
MPLLDVVAMRFPGTGGGGERSAADVRDNYLALIERVEPGLRNFVKDPAVWARLYGRRYWSIQEMTSDSPRWGSMVFEEAQEQKRFVEGLVERITRFQEWTNAAPGRMVWKPTCVLEEPSTSDGDELDTMSVPPRGAEPL